MLSKPANLLAGGWTAASIEELLARHPRRPLLPPLGDEAWHKAAANPLVRQWALPLRKLAEAECSVPLPELTDELYASFRKTGVRLTFEVDYAERRRRLARVATSLLLCAEDDPWRQRLEASVVEKFTGIFEEVSWALPAHVNWNNNDPSGKDPLEIDLCCADTANMLAEMLDLFGTILPVALQERVRARLHSAIFENYRNHTFHWETITNNWNAVCHQGVLGAALSQLDDTHLLAELLAKAAKALPAFLTGFGPDGGCSEGPGYWSYGFGRFTILNEQLEMRTGGELSLFESNEKIRAMAHYGPRVCLGGGNLVNFADGDAVGGLDPALLTYLGTRFGEPDFHEFAMEQFRQLAASGLAIDSTRYDLFFPCRLFLRSPEALPPSSFAAEPADCYLPDLAVLVAHGTDIRGHRWDFAAKAGHNAEHHNHNDCGGYILNIDGVRLITEIGAPEYVHGYFGEERYENLAARTLGHSLPIVNGCEQAAGAQHTSRVIQYAIGTDPAFFLIEAARCYPAEAGCRSFLRTLRLDKKAGKLLLEDAFDLARTDSLEDALVTCQPVELTPHGEAVIEAQDLALQIRPLPGTRLDRVEPHSYRDHDGKNATIHRLVFVPQMLEAQVRIGLELTLD